MARGKQSPDSAGPSRDGHEFHEAWTARKAMQLLLPSDGLIGIAVEGLSKEDESRASASTIEIALRSFHCQPATSLIGHGHYHAGRLPRRPPHGAINCPMRKGEVLVSG